MSVYLNYNGKLISQEVPVISADNRSFRYGDGCFETMKMINGNIMLAAYHWRRLFRSLSLLEFEIPRSFDDEFLLQQIAALATTNNHEALCRIRLNCFRGDGTVYDVANNSVQFIIQTSALPHMPTYTERGAVIGVYPKARLSTDTFCNIKSNNYLPYLMAVKWYKSGALDDALLLNMHGRICEATTSNLFMVKNGVVKTPALSEGCVAGVTRHYLLECMAGTGMKFEETSLTPEDVLDADEVFLTNAGFYIQWVRQMGKKEYVNDVSRELYHRFIHKLFL